MAADPRLVCKCGTPTFRAVYKRGVSGLGFWTCPDCGSHINPNPILGHLTREDMDRLEKVARLHSNDGWGDLWRHEPVIACTIGEPYGVDTQPAVLSSATLDALDAMS